jgi:hypothetical protein
MERVTRDLVRTGLSHLEVKVQKRGARTVSSLCRDHHYGREVAQVESRWTFRPTVYLHCIGIYPFLSGLHLTIDIRRTGRDEEG